MQSNDLFLLSLNELPLKRSVEVLPQLKEYIKHNYSKEGLFCLAVAQFPLRLDDPTLARLVFRISDHHHTLLQTLQARDQFITMHMYCMRVNLTKELAMLSAMDRANKNSIF